MKKLKYDIYISGKVMVDKLNEVIDFLQPVPQTEFNAFCRGKVEIDKNEWEVIKKCLKYCRHRYYDHTHHSGIHFALSAKDVEIFDRIISNL